MFEVSCPLLGDVPVGAEDIGRAVGVLLQTTASLRQAPIAETKCVLDSDLLSTWGLISIPDPEMTMGNLPRLVVKVIFFGGQPM